VAGSQQAMQNVAPLREIMLLRDESARLLGYKSHADYRLVHRMALLLEWTLDLLGQLKAAVQPAARARLEELDARKKRDCDPESELLAHDVSYYSCILDDEKAVRIHFCFGPDKHAWAKFRKEILRYGGSRDEWDLVQQFLGHPARINALLRSLGLALSCLGTR